MIVMKKFMMRCIHLALFAILASTGVIAYGDEANELAPGEARVVLSVENMT